MSAICRVQGHPGLARPVEFVGHLAYPLQAPETSIGNMNEDDPLQGLDIGRLYTDLFGDSPLRLMISRADDGVIVSVSESLLTETLGGLDRESIIGKTGVEVGIWENNRSRDELVSVLREQGSNFRRFDYQDHKGKDRTQLRYSRMLEQNGTEYVAGIALEVSELRETEERLRAAAERLEEAQKIAGIGDYIYDPATDQLTGSPMLFNILQHAVSTNPVPLEQVLDQLELDEKNQVLQNVRHSTGSFEIEVSLIHSGQVSWIKFTGSAATATQPAKGVVQNVTESRLRESERERVLLQIQEAQKLARLGLLAGGVGAGGSIRSGGRRIALRSEALGVADVQEVAYGWDDIDALGAPSRSNRP